MPAQTQKKIYPATYQDVLDAPRNMVAEIIGGILHTHPRPSARHALAGSSLGFDLSGPFQFGRGGPGGWWIIDEPELHIGGEIVVPDLAGWRRETLPDYPNTAFFEITPDWVCEVLSPGTRKLDLYGKRPFYAEQNINHLWLIDPIEREFEAFELQNGHWLLIAALKDDDQVSVRPFDAVSFSLADLWPDVTGSSDGDVEQGS